MIFPSEELFCDAYLSWVKGCQRVKLMKDKSIDSITNSCIQYPRYNRCCETQRPLVLHIGGGVGTRHLPEFLATVQSVVLNTFWRASNALVPDEVHIKDELKVHINTVTEVVCVVLREVLGDHNAFFPTILAQLPLALKNTIITYLRGKG